VPLTTTHTARHVEALFDLVAVALLAAAVFVPGYASGCSNQRYRQWIIVLLGAGTTCVALAVAIATRGTRSAHGAAPEREPLTWRDRLPTVPTLVTIVFMVVAWREMGAGACGE
jgi:hypothetical protein